jgi:hypothetical protein
VFIYDYYSLIVDLFHDCHYKNDYNDDDEKLKGIFDRNKRIKIGVNYN